MQSVPLNLPTSRRAIRVRPIEHGPRRRFALDSSPKGEQDRSHDAPQRKGVIPTDRLAKIEVGEYDEDRQGDAFLNNLELIPGELAIADSVRGHLKAVLAKRDKPADDDSLHHRDGRMLQMSVPGEGHEGIGDKQQNYGAHRKIS